MMARKLITILCVLCGTPAIAAPKQLYGKSVVVAWSETIESKAAGETIVRNHAVGRTLGIYINDTDARLDW
jgi:hypothetical protein